MISLRPAAPDHYRWIASRAQITPGQGFCAIEVIQNGTVPEKILGMVGFDAWTPSAVSMHVAVDDPRILRRLIRPAFGVAFYEFGKDVVVVTIKSTNARSLKLAQGLGFREVFRGKDWSEIGVDLVFLEMRRRDCRWVA